MQNPSKNGLKIIIKYLKDYKKDLIILSILGIIAAVLESIIPYLTGRLVDAILDPSNSGKICA